MKMMFETKYMISTEQQKSTELIVNLRASRRSLRGVAIFLIVMVTACTADSNIQAPDHILEMDNVTIHSAEDIQAADTLKLIYKQSYGESDDVMFGSPSFIDVDGSGRVYIADRQENDIKVFNNEGEFVRTVGRSGDGPGEFRQISSVLIENHSLWVYDNNLKRVNSYDTETGHYNHGSRIAVNRSDFEDLDSRYVRGIHRLPNSRFLIDFLKTEMPENVTGWETVQNRSSFYIMNHHGELTGGPIFEKPSSYHVMMVAGPRITGTPVDFYPSLQVGAAGNGRIYVMWPEHFLLEIYDERGEQEQAIYYPIERVSYDPAGSFDGEQNELTERARREVDFPAFEPVSDRMLMDDRDRVWVSVNTHEPNKDEWWVLDLDGKLLARFSWPSDEPLETVRGDHVYTKQTEPGSGLQNVVRYRIQIGRQDA
ncbi:MAG: 6-bladed beta-propeller [Balneolaceae bacterium]|nr:MAG: 6-bladed beta-propeller [Balneolaceae bacterium]